jgi:CDP-paratose 2-epimerase
MKQKTAIVTGSSGLIGSQTVKFLIDKGYYVVGIDNDMRAYFFGKEASTKDSENSMVKEYGSMFNPLNIDIRDYETLELVFKGLTSNEPDIFGHTSDETYDLDMIVHTAAQPSHDWAAKEPLTDFSVNANGTLNLLELSRIYCPKATFVFTSTNKVYGDRPNLSYETGTPDEKYRGFQIYETPTRWEAKWSDGSLAAIDEDMSIDSCKHSIFGASKVAADVMVQEYGRYFGMNTVVFRGGCLTGPNHAGAELHGFLAYLIKCIVNRKHYNIFGYKGKQVRDNIHSWDLVNMFWHYHLNPKPASVYNAGGGRDNSTSVLEAIDTVNRILKEKGVNDAWSDYTLLEDNRIGDHIWYISDLAKFKADYPEWPGITISLEETIRQMIDFEIEKSKSDLIEFPVMD